MTGMHNGEAMPGSSFSGMMMNIDSSMGPGGLFTATGYGIVSNHEDVNMCKKADFHEYMGQLYNSIQNRPKVLCGFAVDINTGNIVKEDLITVIDSSGKAVVIPGSKVGLPCHYDIPAGTYEVKMSKEGHRVVSPPITITLNDAKPFEILYFYFQDEPLKINLHLGWNFISLPIKPIDIAIDKVLADIYMNVGVVWGYDNENQQWLRWKPSDPASTLTSLESGKGYWINMKESGTISILTDSPPNTIMLHDGWNLIGHTRDNKDVIGFLKDFKVKKYIMWSWKDGQWLLNMDIPPQMPVNLLTTIERNKAYWVKTRERCE